MAKKKKAAVAKRRVTHVAHDDPPDEDELEHEEEEMQDNPAETALRELIELCEKMGMRDHAAVVKARDALPKEEPHEDC